MMTEELVLYTNPMSRGRIVRWMLQELGQPYRTELLDYATSMKAPAYLAVNPMGKVPALKHGELVITEGAAICMYLADAFPAANLAPALTDPRRAAYLRWFFFAAGPLESAMVSKALGHEVPADKAAVAGWGSMALVVATLEAAVAKGPFLLGEQFTALDVFVGASVAFGMQFGTLPASAVFSAYVARLSARPAATAAREIDDALLQH